MTAERQPRGNEPDNPRRRRDRDNIRSLLLESAIHEFGEHGFAGASTTSIAKRAEAHQPQINYHFSSKEELWRAAVDELFKRLDAHLADIDFGTDLAEGFALLIRRLVELAVTQPELNQIMTHEGTAPSERLNWVTETHVRPRYDAIRGLWRTLRERGVAAPIDESMIHYVIVGVTSLPYMNLAEARLLLDDDPVDAAAIDRHATQLVDTLLPGRAT